MGPDPVVVLPPLLGAHLDVDAIPKPLQRGETEPITRLTGLPPFRRIVS